MFCWTCIENSTALKMWIGRLLPTPDSDRRERSVLQTSREIDDKYSVVPKAQYSTCTIILKLNLVIDGKRSAHV